MARLLIATPVRGAELPAALVSAGYAEATRALSALVPTHTRLVFALDVVRARNRAVSLLLSESDLADVTHVLWWDDDQWPEDVTVVPEMMALGLDVVGGAYTNKRAPVRFVHQVWEDRREVDARGCLDVRGVGMGFTLTSRACLEAMAAKAEWYWDLPREAQCPNIFGQVYDDFGGRRVLLSEDFSFCKRWREHGGKVYVYGRAGLIFHAGSHAWNAKEIAR